jgi:hypothetical protein
MPASQPPRVAYEKTEVPSTPEPYCWLRPSNTQPEGREQYCRRSFDQRILYRDRAPTCAAAPPENDPGCNRNQIIPCEGLGARHACRSPAQRALTAAKYYDVEKAAYTEAEHPEGEHQKKHGKSLNPARQCSVQRVKYITSPRGGALRTKRPREWVLALDQSTASILAQSNVSSPIARSRVLSAYRVF